MLGPPVLRMFSRDCIPPVTFLVCTHTDILQAAALSLQDVFALPMALFIPDAKDFAQELAANFSARSRFDQGQYSEPLMSDFFCLRA